MPVYDVKTGEAVEYETGEALNNSVRAGTHRPRKGSRVRIYKPDDPYKVYSVPAENLDGAMSDGYVMETITQRGLSDAVKDNRGMIGSLKVAGYEFANSLLFSAPEIIYRNTADPKDVAIAGAIREDHPGASITGQILGTVGNVAGLAKTGALKMSEQVAKNLTNRIIAAAPKGAVSQSQASSVAGKMISSMANSSVKGARVVARNAIQGSIEGGMDMTIPALTEGLFGDWNEAGEAMMVGMGFGGVIGGGVRTFGDLLGATKNLGGKSKKFLTTPGKAGEGNQMQEAALKQLSSTTNTNIDMLRDTLGSPEKIRNASKFSNLYDEMSNMKRLEKEKLVVADDAYIKADSDLDYKFRTKADEMRDAAKAPSQPMADRIEQDAGELKSFLHLKSVEADEMLVREAAGPVIPRGVMVKNIDSAIEHMKKSAVGVTDTGAVRRLEALRENIVEVVPEFMDGQTARGYLRSIRNDISWNRNLADFDENYNMALKAVTQDFSKAIKGQAPGYAAIMEEMAPKADFLSRNRQIFDSPQARTSMARRFAKDPKKYTDGDLYAMRQMDEFFSHTRAMDGMEDVELLYRDMAKDQTSAVLFGKALRGANLQKGSKAIDKLKEQAFPEDYATRTLAKEELDRVKTSQIDMDAILSGDDIEKRMRRFTSDDKNIRLNRAMKALTEANDSPEFLDKMKYSLIKDGFDAARTQGSRSTVLHSIIGSGFGSTLLGMPGVGAIAGAITGAGLDRFGGKLIGQLIDDNPTANMIRSLLVAEDQLAKQAIKFGQIPKNIQKFVLMKPAERASNRRKINAVLNKLMIQIIAENKTETSITKEERQMVEKDGAIFEKKIRIKAWKSVGTMLARLSDPAQMQAKMETAMAGMAEGGAPNIAMKMGEKMIQGVEYLQGEIPKSPMPPSPFYDDTWEPSDFALREFEEKLLVVFDPMVVFDALEAGVLTKNYTNSLKAVYPAMHQSIQKKTFEAVTEGDLNLEYSDKVSIGYILDMPLDPSATIESYAYYQRGTTDEDVEQETPIGEEEKAFAPNMKTPDTYSMRSRSSQISS